MKSEITKISRSETKSRSFLKALTHRAIMTAVGFFIVLIGTGNLQFSVIFFLINAVVGTIVYFAHERVWAKIRWGIRK